MRQIDLTFGTLGARVIPVGYQGENLALQIAIDCTEVLEEFPNSMAHLIVTDPAGDDHEHDALMQDGILLWQVRSCDTIAAGTGEVRVTFTDAEEETVLKTAHSSYMVLEIGEVAEDVPEQLADWMQQAGLTLTDLRQGMMALEVYGEAETARQAAERARAEAVEAAAAAAEMLEELDAEAQTLEPGEAATAELIEVNDHKRLLLGIPQGQHGVNGISPTIAVSEIEGGHRVTTVDADGTDYFDVMDGVDGQDGTDGTDGVDGISPTVSTEAITGGTKVTITDGTGDHELNVMDGEGVPEGGTTGQWLKKKSATDFDTEWANLPESTTNYNDLSNKPSINNVALTGDKSLTDLGIASAADVAAKYTKPAGGIPATDIADGVIPDITGKLNKPSTAGTEGQVLTSDGQGGQTWEDADAVMVTPTFTMVSESSATCDMSFAQILAAIQDGTCKTALGVVGQSMYGFTLLAYDTTYIRFGGCLFNANTPVSIFGINVTMFSGGMISATYGTLEQGYMHIPLFTKSGNTWSCGDDYADVRTWVEAGRCVHAMAIDGTQVITLPLWSHSANGSLDTHDITFAKKTVQNGTLTLTLLKLNQNESVTATEQVIGGAAIDDTAGAGDTDVTWSADKIDSEVEELKSGLEQNPHIVQTDASGDDLDVIDDDGNVIMRLKDGHIQTKEFDSDEINAARTTTAISDLDLVDEDGNAIVRFKNGHIQTKNFDSERESGIIGKNADITDGVYAACRWHQPNASSKQFCMLIAGDMHTDPTRMKRLIEYLNAVDAFDVGIMLGDISGNTFADSISYYSSALMSTQRPFLTVLGNHDVGGATSDAELYQKYGGLFQYANLASGEPVSGKCYYYKDFSSYKIRIIVLMQYDLVTRTSDTGDLCFGQEQVDWLITTLSSTPSDYGVIIAEHTNPSRYMTYNLNAEYTSSTWYQSNYAPTVMSGDPVPDIVNAWINGTTLSQTYSYTYENPPSDLTVSADFTTRGAGEFITYIGGHWHMDVLGTPTSYTDQHDYHVPAAGLNAATQGDIPRRAGTVSEDSFCALAVDRDKKTVKIFHIGAHRTKDAVDRQYFKYGYGE